MKALKIFLPLNQSYFSAWWPLHPVLYLIPISETLYYLPPPKYTLGLLCLNQVHYLPSFHF